MEVIQKELVRDIIENFPKLMNKNNTEIEKMLSEITESYTIKANHREDDKEDLQEKIKFYIKGKRAEGLADRTLVDYYNELQLFSRSVHKKAHQITSNDIRMYISDLEDIKRSTLIKKLQTLKGFFGWLHDEDIIPVDPSKKVKSPKPEKRVNTFFSIKELEMLRDACKTLRAKALLEFTYSTGCRVSEVVGVKLEDVDFNNMSLNVIGKGNKERKVYFNERALHALNRYLQERNDDCEYLFVTERRPFRQVSTKGVQTIFSQLSEDSKIGRKVRPHDCRRSFASHALERGTDIVVIQHILGHSNISTTEIYCELSEKRKEFEYRRLMSQ